MRKLLVALVVVSLTGQANAGTAREMLELLESAPGPEQKQAVLLWFGGFQSGVTWANLARPCLEDTFKPTYAIPKRLRCSKDDLPIAYDWRYFGRIEATDTGMRFVTEETWPPKPNVEIPTTIYRYT